MQFSWLLVLPASVANAGGFLSNYRKSKTTYFVAQNILDKQPIKIHQ